MYSKIIIPPPLRIIGAGGPGKKRGPGRPSTKPNPPSLERIGVTQEPNDPADAMELVYNKPDIFKELFAYFKGIKAANIHLRLTPAAMTFFTRDKHKLTRVIAHIDGSKVNHYFCDQEYWLGMTRDLFEKMFAQIDKTLYKISIILKADDKDSMWFIFKNAIIDKECSYKMQLAKLEPDLELFESEKLLSARNLAMNFPVCYTLSDKDFKKTVSDVANYSDTMTFEKLGKEPLQITYMRTAAKYYEIYRTPEKIKLVSTVSDVDNFRCTLRVDSIKPLAASMVEENVRIMCCDKGDMIFRTEFAHDSEEVLTLSTIVPVM
jgi:hypothetical protein